MERDGIDTSTDREPLPADYLSEFDEDGLTEAQKLELIEVLFQIMKSFVQLGYGMEPVNKLIAEFQKCATSPADLLECKNNPTEGDNE
ncbi:hypothetical protein LPB140_10305 [Sphingorhabdus lutea]|uniref:Uncharacterized protein n=2 Tax=Sphingorhabdus lutea TaxID=1913578 RepID=A0A1L3JDE1_9SPHN|nr:hypothetical protein LPB140_10305 [Sphingorhabdus lutea]